jgi:hypothetical protein
VSARRRGRSGGRAALVLLLVAVLVVGLLVAGDRVAASVVEDRVGRQLQTELNTPAPVAVDIRRFPFVSQVLRESFSSVHVVADDVTPTDQQPTALQHVDLELRDVTSGDGFATTTARRAEGTATFDYATAKQLTGLELRYAAEGRVEFSSQTQLLGVPVTATVVGRPLLDVAAQTLSLADPEITVAGVDVPDTTSQALLDALVKPAPITGVPYGLTVTEITAQPDGLTAEVTGENVTFSRQR